MKTKEFVVYVYQDSMSIRECSVEQADYSARDADNRSIFRYELCFAGVADKVLARERAVAEIFRHKVANQGSARLTLVDIFATSDKKRPSQKSHQLSDKPHQLSLFDE